MKGIASPGSLHDTRCLGLVHRDDQRDDTRREVGGGYRMVITAMKLKDAYSLWKESYDQPRYYLDIT